MAKGSEYERGVPTVSLEQIKDLLTDILRISKLWAIVVAVAAVLSAFDMSRTGNGDMTVGFQITTTTALLLSLMWLPGLIRVIALTGGKFKTPAGEAATSGLLDLLKGLTPDTKREALPPVIAAFDMVAAEKPLERDAARRARDDLENQLAAAEPASSDSRQALRDYAERYEQLREELDPGSERTFQMNSLLVEARAVAQAARLTDDEIRELFASERPGLRLMAIAALQANPRSSAFSVLLDAISNSRSAFEQYHALAAARDHVPLMTGDQRQTLKEALQRQLDDPMKGINEDGSRHREVQGLLAELDAP